MKIQLREIRESDLPFLNSCRNKYSISKNLNLFRPQNIEKERKWLVSTRDEIHFLIIIDDSEPVGQVSLINFSHKDRKAELTIFLDNKYWGKGHGKIATKLMLDYAFLELNLNKIYLHVYDGNDRAIKMYESIGFLREGVLRDFIYKRGKYISAYHYGILKNEYFEKSETNSALEILSYNDMRTSK